MKGLRTTIYKVPDIKAAKEWYSKAFETKPYFDEPYYVGFNIEGFELGLLPGEKDVKSGGVTSYWATDNIDESLAHFVDLGAEVCEEKMDVGDGVMLAAVSDPWGNPVGLIQNRFFRFGAESDKPVEAVSPGVTAGGGIFFKSQDPEKLKEWYREHLGILAGPWGAVWQWRKESEGNGPGFTVWSPFNHDTNYFEPSGHDYMLNYRVNDLEKLLEKLKQSGIKQIGQMETYDYGKFAWISDPEGRKIELWEPVDDVYLKMGEERMGAS